MHVAVFVSMLLFAWFIACDLSGEKLGDDDEPDEDGGGNGGDGNGDDDCVDADEDGWCADQDCNDFDKTIYPGGQEDCHDLIDNDCDFLIDEQDPDCPAQDDDVS